VHFYAHDSVMSTNETISSISTMFKTLHRTKALLPVGNRVVVFLTNLDLCGLL